MGDKEQTELTLGLFPNLTEEQKDEVLTLWGQNEYADDWHGHQTAQADLLRMCRYESMSVAQREQERVRKG